MVVVAAAGVMLMSACGSESSAGGSLDGQSFLSVTVTEGGKAKQLAPNTRIQLQFLDDGRLSANAGCNSMGGKVATGGGKLAVKDLATTDMGCDPPRHAQDDWLAKLLQDEPTWALAADKLTVSKGDTQLVLQNRETAQPDKPLDSTRWSLETVVSGQTASHPIDAGKAHLTFNGERVTGSTGCNDFQGVVARTGNKVTFGELSVTTAECLDEPAKLEQSVISKLSGELTYSIEADRLQLRAADGSGLDFTAG
ncbi:META domain-containing protein [Streptomyces sp. SID13031]|nr:META domain-containing protein [Streptomyces sp. SID13031]